MGAIDLVVQVESPGIGRARPAAHRPRRPPRRRRRRRGRIFPKFRGDLVECAVVARAHARGRDRGDARAAQPARRARAADRRDACAIGRVAGRRPVRAGAARLPVPRAAARPARRRARHAVGPLPVRRLRRAAAAHRLGPHRRQRHGPARTRAPLAVANAGTIPDRGLYGVFLADGSGRVGELDEEMVYEARVGQMFLLGASSLAHRAHHPRPRARLPRAGPAGQDAVLAAARRRPPGRARPRDRRVRARDPARCPRRRAAGAAAPTGHDLDEPRGRATCALPARPARRPPACCRPTAPSWSSASATSSATGASASCRRSAAACTRRGRWRSARCCASELGVETQALWTDDGIVLRLPDADEPPSGRR